MKRRTPTTYAEAVRALTRALTERDRLRQRLADGARAVLAIQGERDHVHKAYEAARVAPHEAQEGRWKAGVAAADAKALRVDCELRDQKISDLTQQLAASDRARGDAERRVQVLEEREAMLLRVVGDLAAAGRGFAFADREKT